MRAWLLPCRGQPLLSGHRLDMRTVYAEEMRPTSEREHIFLAIPSLSAFHAGIT